MGPEMAAFESLGLRVDTAAHRAELDGRAVDLEPKAFNLLVLLLTNAGQLVTKQEILDTIWAGTAVTDNALTRVVAQLRKALRDDARQATFLETVPTLGYRWIAPVTRGRTRLGAASEPARSGLAADSEPGRSGLAADSERERSRVGVHSGQSPGAVRVDSERSTTRIRVGVAVLLASAAGAALLGLALWLTRDAGRPAPIALHPRQLTTTGGLDVYPSFSPDGRRIAFSSDRTGAWEIYVAAIDHAGSEQPLTAGGNQNVHAAWSPDGRHIAFHSMRHGGIWVMPADGGDARQVTTFGARPAWSPDGRRLTFQSNTSPDIGPSARAANLPSTIWVVDVSAGQPRPLTRAGEPVGGHGSPAWSPDGRHIVFATSDFFGTGIWSLDSDGGEPYPISTAIAPAYDPIYTSDGGSVLFASGTWIWRVPVDANGRPRGEPLAFAAAGLQNIRHLAAAPGGRIAIVALSMRTSLMSAPVDERGVPAGPPRPLTEDTRTRNSVPAFSPDGSRIAVVSSVAGADSDIWVMQADGSGLAQLTGSGTFESMPGWMPDSRRVVFTSIRDRRVGLWQVDADSKGQSVLVDFGSVEALARQQGFVQEARVSPDGTRLLYAQLDPRTASKALYVRPLDGGPATRITSGDPPAAYPAWSPDGRWVAFELMEPTGTALAVVPSSGGTPVRLSSSHGHSWVHGWSPGSDRVVFAGQRNGVWNIYWVPRGGGPEQRVTGNTGVRVFVRYPTWSPRGDSIVYEYGDVRGNVWLLELR